MRYRSLSPSGDYKFGNGSRDFLRDSPATVAQAVTTRLLLLKGEWFLDTSEGTPYATEILGTNTQSTRDRAVRNRILGTQGVREILSYFSEVQDRGFRVTATVDTIYGQITVTQVL